MGLLLLFYPVLVSLNEGRSYWKYLRGFCVEGILCSTSQIMNHKMKISPLPQQLTCSKVCSGTSPDEFMWRLPSM